MKSRTVLIGLDGATFSVLDPLMTSGVMPCLRQLAANGTRAPLMSVIPALTPPAWTSIMTGRGPGRHGIFDFFRKETARSQHLRFLTSRDIDTETVWSMASRQGVRSTVLNFPLTFPAPVIDGHVVPGGWMPWRQLRLGCHPPGLYDRLKAQPWFNARELAMDMAHEAKALEGCRHDEYGGWIDLHVRREQQWARVLAYLMREDPVDLTAVLFDGVDKLQHLCWRFISPADDASVAEEWPREMRERCLAYFRQLDDIIAQIIAQAGPEATIMLVSDHGFGPQVRTFFVNSWLQAQGLLAWVDGKTPQISDTAVLGMSHLAKHVFLLDWTRTVAYAPMPSGNGIHIVQADDEHPGGVPAHEYEAFRSLLMRRLLDLRDPSGDRVVAQVWKREEIFDGPHLDLAPDLTLELQDGGLVSILAADEPVQQRSEPTGTHRPQGIFVAKGPGILQGASLPALSLVDVAPLLLHTLQLPVPDDLEGRVPEELFEPEAIAARPARRAPATPTLSNVDTASVALDPEAEAEIMKRLQALGYAE